MKTDIQYEFSWGKDSVETVVNRGDVDLKDMEVQTGLSHQVNVEQYIGCLSLSIALTHRVQQNCDQYYFFYTRD